MTDLERIRHSAAHVLATALLKIWPEAQLAAGPPVETGFYYDVDLPHRISPADFERIEAEMKAVTKANQPFVRSAVSRDEAIKLGQAGRLAALSDRAHAEQVQARYPQPHPRGRGNLALHQRRFRRSLRRAARHAHRQRRRVQAHPRLEHLLPRRRKEPAAPAHLRHRLQEQDRDGGPLQPARGGQEARPPQAGPRPAPLPHRRRSRAGARALDAQRRDHPPGTCRTSSAAN